MGLTDGNKQNGDISSKQMEPNETNKQLGAQLNQNEQ
jgi:hypothetical protein